jgi:hypothetical protein
MERMNLEERKEMTLSGDRVVFHEYPRELMPEKAGRRSVDCGVGYNTRTKRCGYLYCAIGRNWRWAETNEVSFEEAQNGINDFPIDFVILNSLNKGIKYKKIVTIF